MSHWMRLVAWMVWLLFPLWAALFLAWVAENRWILEKGPSILGWMVATGIAWAAPFMVRGAALYKQLLSLSQLLWLTDKKWVTPAGLFALAIGAGLNGGRLLIVVLNCALDPSPGEVVTVKEVGFVHQTVRFRVVSDRHAGVEFITHNGTWSKYHPSTVLLHRGRLGLYWCAFHGSRGP